MKKRLIPIALVMGAISANAQVGIGTPTPNKSAELTIQADRRGLLIPNVSLADTTDKERIKNGNVNSLLVFNTTSNNAIQPGYYYWFVDKWERLTADSDIPAIVVNNFENILNMEGDKVTNLIKNIVRNTEGNVIYEGDKLYYINADGDKVEINFGDIVAANESKTIVVSNTSKKQQYYISESYLQVNDTPTQATIDTWTAGTVPAGVYAIDVVGGVVNNFEEVVNHGPINVDGRTFPTINDYITYLTESTGGFTKIVYDPTTGDAIFQEWNEATNTWVNVNNAKFKKIVTDNESKTVIVSNTTKKQQYYIAEAYIQANGVPTQATIDAWTVGNTPEGVYAIDVVGGVVNNFQEFVNHGPITVDGRTYPTINDYITYLTESTGGFTKIVYDSQNRNASFQQWDEATSSWVNVINSKFKKIITDNESQTQIITVNGNQYYVSEAYLAANDGVVPTTVDPANLPAGIYAIDVVGGVVNNFEEIVKNGPITVDGRTYPTINDYITHLTETTGGFTKIVYDQTTGDVIFQEWDASTNSWVNVDNSKFETIVQANESKTTIITVDGKQYYISEEYLIANDGVVPTTVTPENLPAGIYAIDVVGGVVNNFEEIVKNGPITVDGRTYPTINDYITHLTETTGGFTKIVYDQSTGDVIFQEWDASTNSWVNVDNSKFKTIVQANETVTILVTNDNGTFTYYNEEAIDADGKAIESKGVTIDPKEVSVKLNDVTNVYEFRNSKGDVIGEIDANANAIAYNDNSTHLGVTNVQGAIEKLLEKITTVEGTKGALTSPSIYVDGGADALLKDAKIDLKGGSADGQVLVTVTKDVVVGQNPDGSDIVESRKVTEWQDPKEVVSTTVTAKNGITVVNDADGNSEFRLGGALDAATVITTSTTNTLAIAGMENVKTAPAANNLVIADAAGVLKQTSPKNMIEDVITQGDLEAKKLKGVGITVTAGENAGTNLNTEVASSLLKDVTLGIADKAVTAGKLDAGTSTTDAPRIGVADKDGNVTYQDLQTVVQAEQKTVVLEDGTNTTVSSRVDATNPNETIWKVDVANAVKTVATATALAATDAVVLVNAQAAPTEGIVITLPDADVTNKGKKYTVKKLDTNEDGYVVIAGNVAGLNGKTLETGLPYSGWDFVSDGTQWQIVNKF